MDYVGKEMLKLISWVLPETLIPFNPLYTIFYLVSLSLICFSSIIPI